MNNVPQYRVAGVAFDHMHIGDQLRVAQLHPQAEVTGVFDTDKARMDAVCDDLGIATELRHLDLQQMLASARPDIVFVCSPTDQHLEYVRLLAPLEVTIILEKPLSTSHADGLAMHDAIAGTGSEVYVNWPLEWYPAHRMTAKVIAEGLIGDVTEVHYYDGNRGPLGHAHGKKTLALGATPEEKNGNWWYDPASGGATYDYLGYGTTLGTWFRDDELPSRVTAMSFVPDGLFVDEQSVTIAEFASGLSTYRTRWGTFTDPWTTQPQPFCGFVVVGTGGTIVSRDFATTLSVQTHERPDVHEIDVDESTETTKNALSYLLHCRETGVAPSGPCTLETALKGQLIVDAARASMAAGKVVEL
ncbi:Gfo/Idh/MocA family protein [Microcella pacifica]|uniref:Gfo/Idh/MocA family oxidoreductase n=1 Tax=Microcella pacifica TaxID=2591847 RepID=A0A9E5JTU3_9MICO|nr:Gfo/Idh/MocA family oxidoreductase [Microcella pacifica]NHF62338.1 Gfo/Idh/MocA family oxidoreductase [Microcella pacifica]